MVGNKTYEARFRQGDVSDERFFDGDLDISYNHTNNQVNIHRVGQSNVYRTRIHEFCRTMRAQSLKEMTVTESEADRFLVSHERLEMIVDRHTGLINRQTLKRDGTVIRDTLQFAATNLAEASRCLV